MRAERDPILADVLRSRMCFLHVHLPWSKGRGASFSRIDVERLGLIARIQRATGRILAIHFTLTRDGVRRFLAYFPVLAIEQLKQQFFETYQGIPITLGKGQIMLFARKLGHSGRRPGYLRPPGGDVYAGLPIEMLPDAEDIDDSKGQCASSHLYPPPIFPTSVELQLMEALMAISSGHDLEKLHTRDEK